MLVVEPEKRFTVDQCLAHPWMTARAPNVNDSTDGLVGGIAGLEMNRRGVVRERTLLASINSVEVTRIPGPNGKDTVEIQKKNPNTGYTEPRPFDARNPEEFVAMGGKGDQELFGGDATSHYTVEDIPSTAGKKTNGAHKHPAKKDEAAAKAGKGNRQ